MSGDTATDLGVTSSADHTTSADIHHELELEYLWHRARKRLPYIITGVALASSLLTFALTWAIIGSRPVSVTFALPKSTGQVSSTPVPANTVATNSGSSGQTALTESELRAEVKVVGGPVFWSGAMPGALYTFNHISAGRDYIRYLPNGHGLSDTQQNYLVIATYKEANAFATIQAAAKLKTGVSLTNSDGSVVYYAKATPTHVYMAFKGLGFQIEIFDPLPGASLKMATTPGLISSII